MADAQGSDPCKRNLVQVQVLSSAPILYAALGVIMAKIKFYKPSGLQKQGTKIDSIDKCDNFEEKKATKSALLKQECATRIKANNVVLFEQSSEENRIELE